MSSKKGDKYCEETELRRGPWTLEEDTMLIHYIARHSEGRWNQLARCSGLKRTGKSCRLRWLNYLKPDVKRGNLSLEEQFLILELHSKWGNRWSRIAQYLPGRTDNEIKNYWRTRVQKQARQLNVDSNSSVFRDVVRCYWMPRLLEKIMSSAHPSLVNPNHPALPTPSHHPLQQLDTTSSASLISQPNPSTSYNYDNCSTELLEFTYDEDLFMTDDSLDALGLATLPAPDCIASVNDWAKSTTVGDGLWSMDELCQVRKQHEYGGGIFG